MLEVSSALHAKPKQLWVRQVGQTCPEHTCKYGDEIVQSGLEHIPRLHARQPEAFLSVVVHN